MTGTQIVERTSASDSTLKQMGPTSRLNSNSGLKENDHN